MQPHQWKTLRQWHGSEKRDEQGNVLPLVRHDPGEVAFVPATGEERAQIAALLQVPVDQVADVEPDRDRLEAQGDIMDVGEATIPTKPPEIPFQPAHELPPADGGEAVG